MKLLIWVMSVPLGKVIVMVPGFVSVACAVKPMW